jgi:hypothetical protein
VGHLLGFWIPVEIRGRSLVRWKALVMAYMPIYIFPDFFLYRRERCISSPNPAQEFSRFSDFLRIFKLVCMVHVCMHVLIYYNDHSLFINITY